MRSQLQKPEHKDLGHNDQRAVMTPKAAYKPTAKRVEDRSLFRRNKKWIRNY